MNSAAVARRMPSTARPRRRSATVVDVAASCRVEAAGDSPRAVVHSVVHSLLVRAALMHRLRLRLLVSRVRRVVVAVAVVASSRAGVRVAVAADSSRAEARAVDEVDSLPVVVVEDSHRQCRSTTRAHFRRSEDSKFA
jgi:hypothetical protein